MQGRWILGAVFSLCALAAGYMTWLMWRAGDSGKWLFGVFTGFFLLLTVAPLVPKAKPKSQPEPPTSTRFVPHWFMMLAMLVLLGTIILAIVGAILRQT
jgi:hypothetical protein